MDLAKDASFDIVSEVNMQEVDNAVNQTNKEIGQRYDFKNSKSQVTVEGKEIKVIADDEYKLKSVIDILKTKLINRKVPVKNLQFGKEEAASGGTIRQMIKIQTGVGTEQAKAIVKDIKDLKLKVQAAIQGDQVRVSGKSKDDLQAVIQSLKEKDYGLDLQFVNFRS